MQHRSFFRLQAVVLLAALFQALPVLAQELRGRVQGVVQDSTQSVIPGAVLTLRNDNTNVEAVRETNAVGRYVFDFVLPGTYTLTAEAEGFRGFVQRNILVQTRGDVTVDANLEVGAVTETVIVEESPVAVKFNSTTMETTLDTKMTNELPLLNRNPFLLAQLDPAVNYRGNPNNSPYHHWAASSMDVGGDTSRKNSLLLDGVPQLLGMKASYVPPIDAVTEVNVQQNATDAEYGHSAGGILSVQMKGGTNEWHGTAYYFGRNPALNARPNSLTPQASVVRRHVWGVTSGNPIVKDKLFNYVTYEAHSTRFPRTQSLTLPTLAERGGDFSNSLNRNGGLRAIYDPLTTQITGDNTSSRLPFANNMVPASRIDSTAQVVMSDMWAPNNPGDNASGANNFRLTYPAMFEYYNISDRVDWNVTDNVKVFGRFSRFKTDEGEPDFSGSILQPRTGAARNTIQAAGDLVWTVNPTTVINVRGSWSKIVDSFVAPEMEIGEEGLERLWPGNNWYASHIRDIPTIFHPQVQAQADSTSNFGRGGFWFQEPKTWNVEGKVSKTMGQHYLKFGHQFRAQRILASRPRGMQFVFRPHETADTIFAPQTAQVGHAYASLLLGTIGGGSVQTIPMNRPHVDVLGFYVHDDFKINQRVTLNLGVRYEYETPIRDPENRLSRFLDFNQQLSGLQQEMGAFPQEALAIRNQPLDIVGGWTFTDADNRYAWKAQTNVVLPRIGVAIRLNNRTALRIGYARYATPPIQEGSALDVLGSTPYPGFSSSTSPLSLAEGVPRAYLSNPFPSSGENFNPLIEPRGKTAGANTTVGTDESTFFNQNWKAGMNDRFSFSVQREVWQRFVVDATFFMNYGHNQPYNRQWNLADPRIGFEQQAQLNRRVDNPFFGVPDSVMPGELRNQRQVLVSQLIRPFPQFLDINEQGIGARDTRYRSFQLKIQRPFANGFNLLVGYNYNRSRNEDFYDNVDEFDQRFTFQRDPQQGQKVTVGGIYELPFGRGRRLGTDMPRALNFVVGGWSVSGIYRYLSGELLNFGGMTVSGDPVLDNPSRGQWFDTSVFSVLPAFTRRSNPWFYDGLRGPYFSNVDMTFNKIFQINEKLDFEFRMEAYNLTNSFMGANPSTDVNNGNFGRIVNQLQNHSGREWQYSARLIW